MSEDTRQSPRAKREAARRRAAQRRGDHFIPQAPSTVRPRSEQAKPKTTTKAPRQAASPRRPAQPRPAQTGLVIPDLTPEEAAAKRQARARQSPEKP